MGSCFSGNKSSGSDAVSSKMDRDNSATSRTNQQAQQTYAGGGDDSSSRLRAEQRRAEQAAEQRRQQRADEAERERQRQAEQARREAAAQAAREEQARRRAAEAEYERQRERERQAERERQERERLAEIERQRIAEQQRIRTIAGNAPVPGQKPGILGTGTPTTGAPVYGDARDLPNPGSGPGSILDLSKPFDPTAPTPSPVEYDDLNLLQKIGRGVTEAFTGIGEDLSMGYRAGLFASDEEKLANLRALRDDDGNRVYSDEDINDFMARTEATRQRQENERAARQAYENQNPTNDPGDGGGGGEGGGGEGETPDPCPDGYRMNPETNACEIDPFQDPFPDPVPSPGIGAIPSMAPNYTAALPTGLPGLMPGTAPAFTVPTPTIQPIAVGTQASSGIGGLAGLPYRPN